LPAHLHAGLDRSGLRELLGRRLGQLLTGASETLRWLAPTPIGEPCPLCGGRAGNRGLVQARHFLADRGLVDFARCGTCESAFPTGGEGAHVPYPDHERPDDPNFVLLLHHYVEAVNGLDWKIPRLEELPYERLRTVLEIGCSLGVALDYCRTAWRADAVGLEPSAWGKAGAAALGLPILHKLLDEAHELGDRRFDLVFATEVIEHVHDPRAFLRSLARRVAGGGILLVTTPRAEELTPRASPGALYASLSAGAHRFVASERALGDLLREAGFRHLRIRPAGATQVALASDRPLPPARSLSPRRLDERLARYYRARLAAPFSAPRFELAYAMHAYDYGVRARAPESVADLPGRIDELLGAIFQLSLERPRELAARVEAAADLFSFGRAVPFGLPFYLRASALDHQSRGRWTRAQELRALGSLVAVHGMRADFLHLFVYDWMFRETDAAARSPLARLRATAITRELFARAGEARRRVPELAPSRSWRGRAYVLLQQLKAARRWRFA
jgi:SAM-dependent methyltransferase